MTIERHIRPPSAAQSDTRGLRRAISWLAQRQHGVVARIQLLEIGLTRHDIAGLLATGHLHTIYRGVYAVGHRRLTREGAWLAAVFACGDGARLSHGAGAGLWRMLPPIRGPIDVTAPRHLRGQHGIRVHRGAIDPRDTRVRDGIPTTSPERTLLDLAATHPKTLDKAVREAHYLRLVSATSLAAICKRHKGHRGSMALKRAIEKADLTRGPTHEEFERRFRRFLKKHKLPLPTFNPALEISGRIIHPDCLWQAQRLIVELDSRQAHATPHAFEADRARDRKLQAAGYRVIRITWRQLRDEPEALLMDLQAFLAEPAPADR